MEPLQEAKCAAESALSLLSDRNQQAAKRTHYGADSSEVIRQEVRASTSSSGSKKRILSLSYCHDYCYFSTMVLMMERRLWWT